MSLDVDVRFLSAASGSTADLITAIQAGLNTGTKFTVEGSDVNGFWFSAVAASETWEGSLFNDAGTIQISKDANASYIASDNVSDTSEWSTMRDWIDFSGAVSPDFYLVELPDAFFVLFLIVGNSQIAEAGHAGNIWLSMPFRNEVDGLGWLGDQIGNGSGEWYSTPGLANNQKREVYVVDNGGWFNTSGNAEPSNRNYPNNSRVPSCLVLDLHERNSGSNFRDQAGFYKYIYFSPQGTSTQVGNFETNGVDTFVYVDSFSNGNTDFIIPWDFSVIPTFA